MSAEERLRELRTNVAQAQARRTRATIDLEAATTTAEAAKTRLKEEFGVETLEQAQEMLKGLTDTLSTEVATLETHLAQAGA